MDNFFINNVMNHCPVLFINNVMNHCPVLKYRYCGNWSADNIPMMETGKFAIANTSPSNSPGTHWVLIFSQTPDEMTFWDPLGLSLSLNYRLGVILRRTHQLVFRIQDPNSNLCGAYCIHMAHYVYSLTSISQLDAQDFTVLNVIDSINAHFSRSPLSISLDRYKIKII